MNFEETHTVNRAGWKELKTEMTKAVVVCWMCSERAREKNSLCRVHCRQKKKRTCQKWFNNVFINLVAICCAQPKIELRLARQFSIQQVTGSKAYHINVSSVSVHSVSAVD